MSPTTCPFCNAVLPVPTPSYCPRCDERVPGGDSGIAAGESPRAAPPTSTAPLWFRIGFPLSCLVSIVLLAGGLYLINLSKRKNESTQPTKTVDNIVGPATVPPVNLAALTYLPANVQVIAAVQTAPINDFAKRSGTDGKSLLLDAGLNPSIFDSLAKAGVPYESIDHVACGLMLPADNVIPTVSLVVVLKAAPSDPKGLVRSFEKEKLFNLLPVSAKIVNDRVLLAGSDLSKFPATPFANGAEHLSASIRETIGKQISPAAVAWLATESQTWQDRPGIKALILASGKPEWTNVVSKGRAAALSLSFEPEFTLGVAIKCDGEESAKTLQNEWGIRGAGQSWLIGGIEGWATLDVAVPPKEIPRLVGSLLPSKK